MNLTMKALPVKMLLVVFLCKYSMAANDCTTDLPEGLQIPVVPTDVDKWKPSNCEWDNSNLWVHLICMQVQVSYTYLSTVLRPQIGSRGTGSWAMFSVSQVKANGLWCQVRDVHSANMSSNIGDWYYPTPLNGTTLVPTSPNNTAPYLSLKCTNQTGLIIVGNVTDYQGIVRCVTTVPNLSRQANFFGVYSDEVFSNYSEQFLSQH